MGLGKRTKWQLLVLTANNLLTTLVPHCSLAVLNKQWKVLFVCLFVFKQAFNYINQTIHFSDIAQNIKTEYTVFLF